jgi:HSP20 family protein
LIKIKEFEMLIKSFNRVGGFKELQDTFEKMSELFNMIQDVERETPKADFIPAVNTREANDAYFVEVDIPGVKKEDVKIDVEDNALRISGERKFPKGREDEDFYRVETLYGKFERVFSLPEDVDASKIEAEMEDGVLHIKIPKTQIVDKAPKKIEIK